MLARIWVLRHLNGADLDAVVFLKQPSQIFQYRIDKRKRNYVETVEFDRAQQIITGIFRGLQPRAVNIGHSIVIVRECNLSKLPTSPHITGITRRIFSTQSLCFCEIACTLLVIYLLLIAGDRDTFNYPLPAYPELHRSRPRACDGAGPDRAQRREGAGA